MQIEIMDITEKPIDLISLAAGKCYGHDNTSEKRVDRAYKDRHMSIFEHAKVSFRVDGLSRACANQLVRHRMASYCQESQRYVKIDTDNDWYISVDFGEDEHNGVDVGDIFDKAMQFSGWAYKRLIQGGVPAEDARMVLPNACKTSIFVTMNLREFYHFLNLRSSHRAQWEIRALAEEVKETVKGYNDQWEHLIGLWENDEER